MQGILGAIGKTLISLQEQGEVIIERTEELYMDEILYSVEKTLIDVKAAYKIEELEANLKIKITLQ
ncbi:hypothetical protein ACFFJQ_14285 [Bacillus capparidis]|uniref:Uncharacterized protein n=1 Tax=Bacillus capparidis TaxID=1840411 RepID=A0ABS4CUH1_9BACI|nr:hypothetical protein [Bacillus capparidis]MBP1080773.1 hypothetical protein [Bacillus capparidis]MED1094625.1 hypothetical protein [Bacillus capparidis]